MSRYGRSEILDERSLTTHCCLWRMAGFEEVDSPPALAPKGNRRSCFSYALSQALGEPLLFKGKNFPQTDVTCHPASIELASARETSSSITAVRAPMNCSHPG